MQTLCVPLGDDPLTIAKVGPVWLASREVFDDPEAMDGISRAAQAHFFDASDVEPGGVAMLTAASAGEHVLRAYLFSESEGSDQIGIAEIPLDPLPHVLIAGGADTQVVSLVIDPKWIEQIHFPK